MLLPETKEREYRFRLALRMGIPIFFLLLAFISDSLINSYESIQPSFYFTFVILLAFSIYFIFFLIYKGFDVKITESVSKTFTREYLYTYLNKELKNNTDYTLVLLSIDNLNAINIRYGIKNGDKVLFEFTQYIEKYFKDKNIIKFPMGHIKGGDFVIGFKGKKENYNVIVELLCLKSAELKINDIEIQISGAITDSIYSNNLDYLIENLFELQIENKNKKVIRTQEDINPNELESFVINAINKKSVIIMSQNVYEKEKVVMKEYFVKLKSKDGKILHPKSYMKVVNKLGLTAEYDYLVLEKSILNAIKDEDISISITVSPTSLRNYNFLTKIKNILNDNEYLKGRIVLMCSESEYYSHTERYNSTIQSLRREGFKIAIDRLGSLHSSFLYLRDLDIDIVRFDPIYIKDLEKQKYQNILAGFNSMAQDSGIKTWIKMLESDDINNFTKYMKVDYKQGKALALLEKIYED